MCTQHIYWKTVRFEGKSYYLLVTELLLMSGISVSIFVCCEYIKCLSQLILDHCISVTHKKKKLLCHQCHQESKRTCDRQVFERFSLVVNAMDCKSDVKKNIY